MTLDSKEEERSPIIVPPGCLRFFQFVFLKHDQKKTLKKVIVIWVTLKSISVTTAQSVFFPRLSLDEIKQWTHIWTMFSTSRIRKT